MRRREWHEEQPPRYAVTRASPQVGHALPYAAATNVREPVDVLDCQKAREETQLHRNSEGHPALPTSAHGGHPHCPPRLVRPRDAGRAEARVQGELSAEPLRHLGAVHGRLPGYL